MERRQFLSWFSVGVMASYLPVVLAACKTEETATDTETSPETETEFTTVGTAAELEQEGFLLDKGAKVIVIRSPEDQSLVALNPTCTHQGCLVEWKSAEGTFICPCHGSDFAPDGTVTEGPATEALPSYDVKEEEGSILVKTA